MNLEEIPLTRKDLFPFLHTFSEDDFAFALHTVLDYVRDGLNGKEIKQIEYHLRTLRTKIRTRRKRGFASNKNYLARDSHWLSSRFKLPSAFLLSADSAAPPPVAAPLSTSVAISQLSPSEPTVFPMPRRPCLPFQLMTRSSKAKAVSEIRKALPGESEAVIRAISQVEKSGNPDLTSVLPQTVESSGRPTKMRKYPQAAQRSEGKEPVTPEEALSLILSNNFTVQQYESVRNLLGKKGYGDILPSYCKVAAEKQTLTPANIPSASDYEAKGLMNS